MPAGGGKSAVSHTHMQTPNTDTHTYTEIYYENTHTQSHLNRDEPISRRQTQAQQIDGGKSGRIH